MKWFTLELPDKIFGIDTNVVTVFLPTIGIIILAILSYGWIVVPRIDDYENVSSSIKENKAKLAAINEKINYLRTIDMEKLNRDETLINNALLPQKNSYLLVNVVSKLAEKYGFSVDSFKVSLTDLKEPDEEAKKSKDDGYATVPVILKLIGSSDNFVNLISGIEESLPLMSFDQFDVKKTGMAVELNLQISAYYATEKSKVDVAKLSLADLTMDKNEGELVAKISQFKAVENMELIEGKLKLDGQFVKYQRNNPFSL